MVIKYWNPQTSPLFTFSIRSLQLYLKLSLKEKGKAKNTITCVLLKAFETTVWVHHHTASWFTFEILRDPKV